MKTISTKQLLEAVENGAKILGEEKQNELVPLVEAIKQLVESPVEFSADLTGIQTLLAMLVEEQRQTREALERLASKQQILPSPPRIDFSPLAEELKDIGKTNPVKFEIERDGRGLLKSVVAVPMTVQ